MLKKILRVFLFWDLDGGKAKGKADLDIIVPSNITARIQECHIMLGHIYI